MGDRPLASHRHVPNLGRNGSYNPLPIGAMDCSILNCLNNCGRISDFDLPTVSMEKLLYVVHVEEAKVSIN